MKTFGTVADVAEMSGKSTNSVIRYSDDGKIDCLTTDKGHRLFIDPKESARQLVQAMGKVKKKKDDKGEVKENGKILELLSKSLGVDHGYDAAAWKKWWAKNEARFRDVP